MQYFTRKIGLIGGPLSFLLILFFFKSEGLSHEATGVMAVTSWMAIWWITEAIPIAATALLPIVLFPVTGAMEMGSTTASYGHKYVFLYLGGFMLAAAIEKWNVHRRIALNIIQIVGTDTSRIILGFMVATAFLSMWISNTATSVMMLPIGMAIISQFKQTSDREVVKSFGKALMLSIAYSASIGGIATLIGTPPNLVLAGVVKEYYGTEISFSQWMAFGLPLSCVMLYICWKYLTRFAFDIGKTTMTGGMEEIRNLKLSLGAPGKDEKRVLIVFIVTALLWIFRSFVEKIIPGIDDTSIAMIAGLSLFLIPSSKKWEPLIDWQDTVRIPWGIILLFGGGMALAEGFKVTGLASWIGSQITLFHGVSLLVFLLILVTTVNFLTEITSNLATTAMLLPILVPIAASMDVHPYYLLISATIAASCAFMLPVATPPNAVIFGSGYIRIPDMIKAGIWLNAISIILITILVYFFMPLIWSLD